MSERPSTAPNSKDTPGELLASVDALRRRTRVARHAYWLPLVLFGLLMAVAAPLYVESVESPALRANQDNPALTGLGGDFLERSAALGWYWLAALIGGYLLSLYWYRWHGTRVGVQTPTRAYVIAGIAGTLIGIVLPIALRFLLLNTATVVSNGTSWATMPLLGISNRGMLPHLVIAVGLLVLARLERSRGLTAVVVCYVAAVVLVNIYFETTDFAPGDLSRFSFLLAALLPAPILLVGGTIALVARNRKTS
ncbi:hypothetical protein C7C45_07370 [Micromonospora arborensis]|uniref:Uncharacterized protein n=1 Tax=Micromonospora arborensis TaxID=2116518 RepID=A0A318NN84_9ACTN|nr:hypothetical protein [Micromonospora arborensis]PYC73472.1 hypothetical protein C7C45_07370 [Micromonospora arborensis]